VPYSSSAPGQNYVDKKAVSKFTGLVFGYMAIALLVTAVVALLGGYGLYYLAMQMTADSFALVYFVAMGISVVALIIDEIVLATSFMKGKKGAWVPYIIFAVILGLFGATFTLWLEPYTIAEAFGISAIAFAVMYLVGYFGGGSVGPFLLISIGVMSGLSLIAIIFLPLYFIFGWSTAYSIYITIFVVMLIAECFMVGWDSWRMRKDIEMGGIMSQNAALYYAFVFYNDFIAIFVRVLILLAYVKRD
jgi:FtsH-binding integral membrane protein